uniref:non-specific serine/threonine protein kinase n=1 Tax=Chromera velia CCMP2878 TaxID=1169474 RepID=A0A0G4G779_9ALVE|eukprot:Cvel_4236.t1-p1 / transcript=Cvel_4236.t1 / gene=Cvel_4236 / organism=Chromera_velia_CCMP2878 / gene_product=Serine/threonine-protein kinase CBK1, putative / transcript_product=Serine/threonine-protein kinase CBK1, putative / location=Cvel_scaffold183:50746-55971(-) / protein_length=471 / sequence_SO=supercontig / SO=protein_coding / is_pseudo=false
MESRVEKVNKDFQDRTDVERGLQQVAGGAPHEAQLMEEYGREQAEYLRASRKRETTEDYEPLKILGQGAFGVVRLVRRRADGAVLALKQMPKKLMQNKNQRNRVLAERSALSSLDNAPGVVSLYSTFQDGDNLYLAMEYLPGGDFMSHLIRLDILTEDVTRFYIAELVQAVDEVHKRGYVHRDIKPDNIVLDRYGHLKLLDFGLCTVDPLAGATDSQKEKHNEKLQRGELQTPRHAKPGAPPVTPGRDGAADGPAKPQHPGRALLKSSVGTPQYMAPEVFRRSGYTASADLWSVGIILFECLYGGVPFSDPSNNPYTVGHKVVNWHKFLRLPHPSRPQVSGEAVSLMKGLLCEPEKRLSADAIRGHPFFKGLRWEKLKDMRPPIAPKLDAPGESGSASARKKGADLNLPQAGGSSNLRKDLDFVGYTYQREAEQKKPTVEKVVGSSGSTGAPPVTPKGSAAPPQQQQRGRH